MNNNKVIAYLRPRDLQLLETQPLIKIKPRLKIAIGIDELNQIVLNSTVEDQVTCVFKTTYSTRNTNFKSIVIYNGNGEFYFNSTRITRKGTAIEVFPGSTIRIKHFTYLFFSGTGNDIKKDDEEELISENTTVSITTGLLGKGNSSKVHYAYLSKHPRLRLSCKETVLTDPYSNLAIGGITKRELVQREIEILKDLCHTNVTMLIHSYDIVNPSNSTRVSRMFMPFCLYGTLRDYIDDGRVARDKSARFVFFQMMLGLRYIHRKGLIHKDIKPENILMDCKTGIPRAVITDFGLALLKSEVRTRTGRLGTTFYNAPETLGRNQEYDEKVDCWAAGIVLFDMLTDGEHPFWDSNETIDILEEHVLNEEPCMNYEFSQNENNHGKELILKLLEKNPKNRASCDDCIKSEWINEPPFRNEFFIHYSDLVKVFVFEAKLWFDIMKKKKKKSPLFSKKLMTTTTSIPRWWKSLKKTDYVVDGARNHFLRKGTYALSYKVTKRNTTKKVVIHGNLRQYLDGRVRADGFVAPGDYISAA